MIKEDWNDIANGRDHLDEDGEPLAFKLSGTVLGVDLALLIRHFDEPARMKLAYELLSLNTVNEFIGMLITGSPKGESRNWYDEHSVMHLRSQLVPIMPLGMRAIVKKALEDRDHANARASMSEKRMWFEMSKRPREKTGHRGATGPTGPGPDDFQAQFEMPPPLTEAQLNSFDRSALEAEIERLTAELETLRK